MLLSAARDSSVKPWIFFASLLGGFFGSRVCWTLGFLGGSGLGFLGGFFTGSSFTGSGSFSIIFTFTALPLSDFGSIMASPPNIDIWIINDAATTRLANANPRISTIFLSRRFKLMLA